MRLIQTKRRHYGKATATTRQKNYQQQSINYAYHREDNGYGQTGQGIASTAAAAIGLAKTAKAGFEKINQFQKGETGTRISNFINSKSSNPNARPGYEGETHMWFPDLKNPRNSVRANYTGPGTNLRLRLSRNDPPVNQIDAAAKEHDIAYSTATNAESVRQADNLFINRVNNATDSAPIIKKAVAGAIRAKTIGEDLNIINPNLFTPGISGSGKRRRKPKHPAARLKSKVLSNLMKKKKGKKQNQDLSMMLTQQILKKLKLGKGGPLDDSPNLHLTPQPAMY